jgi:hypothetical protein
MSDIPYGDNFTEDEYAAILAAHGRCAVYVPSPHAAAAVCGITVPCRERLPADHPTA